ncbi:ABC transporter transmembrane domain-containing protein [Microvirga zambiensis]|uniref:ABC transporter transmembrane domain-containing protein n=1 Tax=Microvirga zambiensis TaxID=1402137 RepID=UPI00191E4DF4|nr:ABC transporter transmembrane domain-containing protein [Microvirga zambiensis]
MSVPNSSFVTESASTGLYKFYGTIWKNTYRTQILLIAVSIAIALLAAAPLYFQQKIINGLTYGIQLNQMLLLGAQYAAAALFTIVLKLFLQYRVAVLGEAAVRHVRRKILANHTDSRRMGSPARYADGTIVSMLTAEAESVGLFVGEAISTPLVEVGMLLSILVYITVNEPVLGLFIALIVLPQGLIAGLVQKPVNLLVRRRVEILRGAVDQTIAADPTSQENAIREAFDEIYRNRRRTHILKLSSKAALNAFTALGSTGTLMIGGWLVLQGQTDVGTVVAALIGLTRIGRPWNNLIKFYRSLSVVVVRYDLLKEAIE